VVKLLAVGQNPEYLGFLITEYASLGNLQQFIRTEAKKVDNHENSLSVFEKQTEFPSQYWIKIILDIAKGMEVLHSSNILHKDLTVTLLVANRN
jgi:serine/threonine protein kinase